MSGSCKLSAAQFLAAFTLLPLTWLIAGPLVVIALSTPVLFYLLSVAARALIRERDWATALLTSPGMLGMGYLLWFAQHTDGANGVAAMLAAAVVLSLQVRLGFALSTHGMQRMRIEVKADQQDVNR